MALGDIHLCFTGQAWHLETSTFVSRGRCGTWRHPTPFCVADFRFAWQAWRLWHWAGSDGALGPTIFDTPSFTHQFVTHHFTHHFVTHHLSHTPSLTHHLSHTTLSHTIFDTPSFTHHLSHTTLSQTTFHTPLCHAPSLSPTIFQRPSFTHNFVTHLFSHTTLSHTIFHI